MEGVDHVHIVQVGGGGFVGDVDGMFQGQVPDGEGFELGVTGLHTAHILLIELAQANGHFAAAGSGGGHHHQRAVGLHILIASKTLWRVNELHIGGVALNQVMIIDADAHALQTLAVCHGAGLAVVVGDHHTAHNKPTVHENVTQTKHILVVCDA